jgi:GH15 family glucan-1,4-alpha-glucosidase
MEAIERDLVEDARVYRYREQDREVDGLRGTEGSFTACSFWYAECLARCRQTEKAHEIFERALGYGNHLGLFSEELGPRGQHQGNFPQALTHLALISAAHTWIGISRVILAPGGSGAHVRNRLSK